MWAASPATARIIVRPASVSTVPFRTWLTSRASDATPAWRARCRTQIGQPVWTVKIPRKTQLFPNLFDKWWEICIEQSLAGLSGVGLTFSFLGVDCLSCDGDNVINEGRSTCNPCLGGQGPVGSANGPERTACAGCNGTSYSQTGVCVECPAPNVVSPDLMRCSPCSPGEQPNADRDMYLRCDSLPGLLVSSDGSSCNSCDGTNVVNDARTTCLSCIAGSGPNHNRTRCIPCVGTTFSQVGVCNNCSGTSSPHSLDEWWTTPQVVWSFHRPEPLLRVLQGTVWSTLIARHACRTLSPLARFCPRSRRRNAFANFSVRQTTSCPVMQLSRWRWAQRESRRLPVVSKPVLLAVRRLCRVHAASDRHHGQHILL